MHEHSTKVLEFKLDEKANYIPALYGCSDCDVTSSSAFLIKEVESEHSQHIDFVDGCFGCKVRTLELSTGDAGRADSMSDKKWNRELQMYRDARSQGIQPAGTSTKAIKEAHEASEKIGKAYNADVMPATSKITKQSAKVMKEVGAI